MNDTDKTATGATTHERFTDEERAAMKERAKELKTATRRGARGAAVDGENDVQEKIAEIPEPERALVARVHAIIKASTPELSPKTWYGLHNDRLQRLGNPGRGHHVADRLRPDGAERRG
ncbi:hypothetical protein [Specibacter sp. RAF43]|uniref:hypothetical protein n=1 Tax=Specibacter sp. RAF43 TaxID=3233057 RepID=UPI003F978FEB